MNVILVYFKIFGHPALTGLRKMAGIRNRNSRIISNLIFGISGALREACILSVVTIIVLYREGDSKLVVQKRETHRSITRWPPLLSSIVDDS